MFTGDISDWIITGWVTGGFILGTLVMLWLLAAAICSIIGYVWDRFCLTSSLSFNPASWFAEKTGVLFRCAWSLTDRAIRGLIKWTGKKEFAKAAGSRQNPNVGGVTRPRKSGATLQRGVGSSQTSTRPLRTCGRGSIHTDLIR